MKQIKNNNVKTSLHSLILSHPFFASLLLQQEIIEDNSRKTFSVDGKILRYNNDFANLLTIDECKAVLAHEVLHLALLHHCRKGNRDNKLWNKACDYAINPELERSGFKLPREKKDSNGKVIFGGPLLESCFSNKSAEEIYRILKQDEEDDKNNNSNNQNQQNSPSNKNGNSPSNGQEESDNVCGEVDSPANSEQAEEETKIQVKQAENFAKACGKLPQNLIRELQKTREAKHDWREVLNRFLTEICQKDNSWNRPNRRFISNGLILPSLYSKTMGNFILAIDTSGSISTAECSIMVKEVLHCLETLLEDRDNVELTVIYCDSEVQNVEVLTDPNDNPLPKGGGGTLFSPVFNYVEENNLDCAALIYLTDGYTGDFWHKNPDYPVLFGLICDNDSFNPPFGETFKFDIHS